MLLAAGMMLLLIGTTASAEPENANCCFEPVKTGVVRCGDAPKQISVELNRSGDAVRRLRIIYHRWEYVDKAAGNAKGIWAMNPDGSGTVEVYSNNVCFPETMIYPRPILGTSSKIVFLGTSYWGPNNAVGAVIVIDTKDDIRSPESMNYITNDIRAYRHNGFHFQNKQGDWVHDKTGTPGRLFKDPYPISEQLFTL